MLNAPDSTSYIEGTLLRAGYGLEEVSVARAGAASKVESARHRESSCCHGTVDLARAKRLKACGRLVDERAGSCHSEVLRCVAALILKEVGGEASITPRRRSTVSQGNTPLRGQCEARCCYECGVEMGELLREASRREDACAGEYTPDAHEP